MIGLPENSSMPRDQITTHIAGRISSGLHLGLLAYGDRLPSTRELAKEFAVDPRVILAAYKSLRDKGVVEMRTRSGIYVTDPQSGAAGGSLRTSWLVDVLAEALGQGIPAAEFGERMRRSMQTLRLRATVLECNDDQLYSVSTELGRDYGLEVTAVDIDTMTDPAVRSISTDCVITTIQHAAIAKELSDALGVPSFALSMCDDLFTEVRRLLPRGPVYFVVSDERFEKKLGRIFAADEGVQNLRILLEGRDSIDALPSDAAVYVTRVMRKKLGAVPLLERLIPEARVFSETSSRDLLTFIVGANQKVLAAR